MWTAENLVSPVVSFELGHCGILVEHDGVHQMQTRTLLRISSGFSALFAIGHSIGAPWTPAKDAAATAVINSMKGVRFTALGADRSYWDFYFGFGISVSVYLFTLTILLWQLSTFAASDPRGARPMMLTMLAAFLIVGAVTVRYFFAPPLLLALIVCLFITWAWWQARHSPRKHLDRLT